MVNLSVVEQLLNHIRHYALCKTTDKILLAVSGGLDSMVMLHLLRTAGFSLAVAHCNFQLRGAEADADERLVEETCRQWSIPFFARRFDTQAYATTHGISIQMAARDLRYNWFEALAASENCDCIATAHHFDDVIESVFLNLVRGTGIDGFQGIQAKKGNVIRPMLFATRLMITTYAHAENIRWREDASNDSDDYRRNYLRHQIIPRLADLNPSFADRFRDTHARMLGARALMLAFVEGVRLRAVKSQDHLMHMEISEIRASPAPAVLLWELIKALGFSYDHCRQIVEDHQPGKIFQSPSHQLLVDRTQYIIGQRQVSEEFAARTLERGQQWVGAPPFLLSAAEVPVAEFRLVKNPSLAQLDLDRLQFPLVWRRWQAGDYFVPLGMQQEKKLSDFLIDLKVPFNSKADITVLESGKEIVWVVGLRISDRYKVVADTRRVLVIEQKYERDQKTFS